MFLLSVRPVRLIAGILLACLAALPAAAGDDAPARPVHWLDLQEPIGSITVNVVADALAAAAADDAEMLVIHLDTPGGLVSATRSIIQDVLASPVPVCVYVGPQGAHAASAGTFLTVAAHVAAMAPGTNLGAASPVSGSGAIPDSTLASKMFEDAEAWIRSLSRLRGRNEEWAASAVRSAEAIPADEALELGVIDFIADDSSELLRKADGLTVAVPGDSSRVLHTAGARIEDARVAWRWRALSVLNDPTVAYLLLMLGFYGIFFELSNPGAIFPGVVGGIALILGLTGLQTLSVNYAGLLLIVLAVVLFFLEIQIQSHGLLAVGGSAALVAGSLMLFDSPLPFLRLSLRVLIPVLLVTVGFFAFAMVLALRAQRRRVVSGREGLVGLTAEVRRALDPEGAVFVAGEHWTAVLEGGGSVPVGGRVTVVGVDHLRLTVRPERTEVP